LFTGVYICSPEIHRWLTPGKVESVIPIFLRMIQESAPIGGLVLDEGHWWDLGSRASYLEAHRTLVALGAAFPAYGGQQRVEPISRTAQIAADASLQGLNIIGASAVVGAGATVENCIVWPSGSIASGAQLRDCIVRSKATATGHHSGADF
ncbi:MAG TPA: hypothetical protein VD994_05100, partial [Prosthecobacter sp.]|nr:hypothetical protein [Prosthecobacter sp.]